MNEGFWAVLQHGVDWIDGKVAAILIPSLLLTGLFFTLRLGFIQVRHLWHGILVTSGKLDKEGHTGDVSHFQALSTALSATVGVGNIAGVAMAIHYGGPGALFWMWVTAFFGMALKYSECTLAMNYREIHADASQGAVSGGPMYYMEKGLGLKPLAIFFASGLLIASFLTGNAIQANSVADVLHTSFGISTWITGIVCALLVAAVILGGIQRIGAVAGYLAPGMAMLYVAGALTILLLNWEEVWPAFLSVFQQAFTPTASITGVGTGAVLTALTMGVKRGLFSNEAGQGSAPIAHSAARTEEPVSEGAVALLEPLIDTLIICTMTGLVLLTTHSWDDRFPSTLHVQSGKWQQESVQVQDGVVPNQAVKFNDGWVDALFVDEGQSQPFNGVVSRDATGAWTAVDSAGVTHPTLYGDAVDMGAPLTARAFKRGLAPLGNWGDLVVTICVALFALSTAISWSYYGDRCAMYLFGVKAIQPYRIMFCILHFVGATATVTTIWGIGDVALSLCTIPNIIALLMLNGKVKSLTDSYFSRRPWENRSAGKKAHQHAA